MQLNGQSPRSDPLYLSRKRGRTNCSSAIYRRPDKSGFKQQDTISSAR